MKRSLVIVFLSIYLFSNTEFHELLRLPALVEHYGDHKKEKPGISLWQFLCMHYAHGDVLDKDHDKDMKLPFKTHDNCGYSNFITLIPEHQLCFEKRTSIFVIKNPHYYYTGFTNSPDLNSIWQPPKVS